MQKSLLSTSRVLFKTFQFILATPIYSISGQHDSLLGPESSEPPVSSCLTVTLKQQGCSKINSKKHHKQLRPPKVNTPNSHVKAPRSTLRVKCVQGSKVLQNRKLKTSPHMIRRKSKRKEVIICPYIKQTVEDKTDILLFLYDMLKNCLASKNKKKSSIQKKNQILTQEHTTHNDILHSTNAIRGRKSKLCVINTRKTIDFDMTVLLLEYDIWQKIINKVQNSIQKNKESYGLPESTEKSFETLMLCLKDEEVEKKMFGVCKNSTENKTLITSDLAENIICKGRNISNFCYNKQKMLVLEYLNSKNNKYCRENCNHTCSLQFLIQYFTNKQEEIRKVYKKAYTVLNSMSIEALGDMVLNLFSGANSIYPSITKCLVESSKNIFQYFTILPNKDESITESSRSRIAVQKKNKKQPKDCIELRTEKMNRLELSYKRKKSGLPNTRILGANNLHPVTFQHSFNFYVQELLEPKVKELTNVLIEEVHPKNSFFSIITNDKSNLRNATSISQSSTVLSNCNSFNQTLETKKDLSDINNQPDIKKLPSSDDTQSFMSNSPTNTLSGNNGNMLITESCETNKKSECLTTLNNNINQCNQQSNISEHSQNILFPEHLRLENTIQHTSKKETVFSCFQKFLEQPTVKCLNNTHENNVIENKKLSKKNIETKYFPILENNCLKISNAVTSTSECLTPTISATNSSKIFPERTTKYVDKDTIQIISSKKPKNNLKIKENDVAAPNDNCVFSNIQPPVTKLHPENTILHTFPKKVDWETQRYMSNDVLLTRPIPFAQSLQVNTQRSMSNRLDREVVLSGIDFNEVPTSVLKKNMDFPLFENEL